MIRFADSNPLEKYLPKEHQILGTDGFLGGVGLVGNASTGNHANQEQWGFTGYFMMMEDLEAF